MAMPEEPTQEQSVPKPEPSAAVTATPSVTARPGVTAAPANTGVGSRIATALTDFWQLGTAIVGIVAAVITGLSYFATHREVSRVECLLNQNILITTLPSEIERLKMKLELEKTQRKELKDEVDQRMKDKEIDDIDNDIRNLEVKNKDVIERMERHVCDSEATSRIETK
jgi:hypothetical protein